MLYCYYKIKFGIYLLFFFVIILASTRLCFSSTGYRTHFLSYGPGVAAAGLGETFIAIGNDLSVIYYNPALLVNLKQEEVSANHWFLSDTARYNFIGFSMPFERNAFAVAGTQFYRGNIIARNGIDDEGAQIKNSQMAMYGAFAKNVKKLKLNCGVSLKYIRYEISESKGTGLGMDIGFYKNLFMKGNPANRYFAVKSGIILQNIYQMGIKMKNEQEDLPREIRIGIAESITFFPRYNKISDNLTYDELSIEYDLKHADNILFHSLGLQYNFIKKLDIRVGWNNGISAGFGFLLSDIKIDYAYISKEIASFHKIGFLYRFGTEISRETSPTFTDEFQKVFKRAQRIYNRYTRDATLLIEQEKYEDAIPLLLKAIPLQPGDNGTAKALINTCKETLVANATQGYIQEARNYKDKGDYINAFKSSLKALDFSENENVRVLLTDISSNDKYIKEFSKEKDIYIDSMLKNIEQLLIKENYNEVDKLYKKLEFISQNTGLVENTKRKINDQKDIITAKYVKKAMESVRKEDFAESFKFFNEANNITPNDLSILDQKEIARKNYLSKRNFSMEDKIYSDKLYYLAAINFATDNEDLGTYNELKSFNIVYDYLPILEEVFLEKGIIKKINLTNK